MLNDRYRVVLLTSLIDLSSDNYLDRKSWSYNGAPSWLEEKGTSEIIRRKPKDFNLTEISEILNLIPLEEILMIFSTMIPEPKLWKFSK